MSHRTPTRARAKSYKYPYCLCVIDMQDTFSASAQVIEPCAELIRQAISDGAFIIVAQYSKLSKPCSTNSYLKQTLRTTAATNYDFCWANQNDKSEVITAAIFRNNVYTNKFMFCGVNTDACVYSTVYGFSKLHPEKEVHIRPEACNTSSGKDYHDEYVGHMSGLPNVYVVS